MSRRFLFLALNLEGWGETALGLGIARDLHAAGDVPVFLALDTNADVLAGCPFEVELVTRCTRPLVRRHVDGLVRRHRPAAIVLCDLHRCQHFFSAHELDARFLGAYGVPLLALDIWDHARTGLVVDAFPGGHLTIAPELAGLSRPLRPVPIVRPEPSPGAYRNLPRSTASDAPPAREALGLGPGAKTVLLTTASWQQRRFPVAAVNRAVAAVPRLLAEHLAPLRDAHLVHVGPAPLDLVPILGRRYLHLGALPPPDFERLLLGVDLVLGLNVSSTTLTRAVVARRPAVLVTNSFDVPCTDAAPPDLAALLTDDVRRWLDQAAPVYPFQLWPMAWARYLEPLLRDNPYPATLAPVELLDARAVRATCEALLFDAGARADQAARQTDYVARVEALPSAREAVETALR